MGEAGDETRGAEKRATVRESDEDVSLKTWTDSDTVRNLWQGDVNKSNMQIVHLA